MEQYLTSERPILLLTRAPTPSACSTESTFFVTILEDAFSIFLDNVNEIDYENQRTESNSKQRHLKWD